MCSFCRSRRKRGRRFCLILNASAAKTDVLVLIRRGRKILRRRGGRLI